MAEPDPARSPDPVSGAAPTLASSPTEPQTETAGSPPPPPRASPSMERFGFGADKRAPGGHLFGDYPDRPRGPAPMAAAGPSWFAADPSKAYYEKFSLIWAPAAMFVLLAVVLGTPLYTHCDRNMLLLLTVLFCVPGVAIPIYFPCDADRVRPLRHRFWVKATVWIVIFDFFGNYFWTHYFYSLLGAQYLFPAHRFNDVPLVCFTATFFYFSFYFNLATVLLRRVDRAVADFPPFGRRLIWVVSVCALSYATALFEAVSIQHFPLYTYTERDAFLTVGSVFYGLYFVVGFPAFFALDEPDANDPFDEHAPTCSVYDAAMGALAASAIVTLLLDLWRLYVGSIYELGVSSARSAQVPFIYQGADKAGETAAAVASATCAPSPTPQIIIVDRPVTAEACAAVAQKWALEQFPVLRRLQ